MAQPITEMLDSREREVRKAIDDLRTKQLAPLEQELAQIVAARKAILAVDPIQLDDMFGDTQGSAFMRMTYEELAKTALSSRFPDGATISELLSFIRSDYGRMISQGSFSPVLSRMREKGVLSKAGKTWRMAPRDDFDSVLR